MKTQKKSIDHVERIVTALDMAKQQTIRRIQKQLQQMSPQDLRALERLIGTR